MRNQSQPYSSVILGGGLQGSCIALELAKSGQEVLLVERDALLMNRASLRNEGKIHLGIIYANDRSLQTGALQLEGALHFRPLLSRWIGTRADDLSLSAPFHYLVARDSVLTPAELQAHYDAIESRCRDRLKENAELDYLGRRPEWIARILPEDRLSRHFIADHFQAAFETTELAIDTHRLSLHIRDSIAENPRIKVLTSHKVRSIERRGELFQIEGDGPEQAFTLTAQQVVNATWESRIAFDQEIGLTNPSGWLHRLKFRMIVRLPKRLFGAPSATMVIGRYGDVVVRPDGTAYLSWYPLGLRGWTHAAQPPMEWEAACRGEADAATVREITDGFLSAIDAWFPGIEDAEPLIVDAGVIVAHGRTDVDDPASGLHDRSLVGVRSVDGYHSVDPGKLTTAPLFAIEAAARALNRNVAVN